MPGEVLVERLRVTRLEPVVELLADLPRELVDERACVDEVERADAFLDEPRRLVQQREIGLDLARRARALHLDGDALPGRQRRTVHLADRRGRDGRAVELEEEPVDGVAELLFENALDVLERHRPHVVLQTAQLDDDVRRHDVGARRQQLAELDERRPELVEHLAQVLAARGARGAFLQHVRRALRLVTGDQVGETVRLEEVAETVPDGDLCDLREAAEITRRRGGHASECCTRFRYCHQPWTISAPCSSLTGAPNASSSSPSGPASKARMAPASTRIASHAATSRISSSIFIRPLPDTITYISSCVACLCPKACRLFGFRLCRLSPPTLVPSSRRANRAEPSSPSPNFGAASSSSRR